jgi:hypothetical protein
MGNKPSQLDKQNSLQDTSSSDINHEQGDLTILKQLSGSILIPKPEPPVDLNPGEDVSMFAADHPEHIPLHIFRPATATGGGKREVCRVEEEVFVDFCVKLMPHQHTLFCERRVILLFYFTLYRHVLSSK